MNDLTTFSLTLPEFIAHVNMRLIIKRHDVNLDLSDNPPVPLCLPQVFAVISIVARVQFKAHLLRIEADPQEQDMAIL
jgi:hypothetical protein